MGHATPLPSGLAAVAQGLLALYFWLSISGYPLLAI